LILLLLLSLLVVGIVHEQGVAAELDGDCASLCALGCAAEGGCRLFRQVGCNCRFVCQSGTIGATSCGS
jgi:hypothetical protein